MDDTVWLEILRQFTTGETVKVTGKLAGHIALGFDDATEEMVAKVMPSLLSPYLEPQYEPYRYVDRFVTIRMVDL